MMAPRGLIGAALLLWGACVGFLPVAVILALAYEGARFARPTPAVARRVTLVGRVVLVAVVLKLGYAAVTAAFPEALYIWLRWLPILLLPLPFVQALAGGSIPGEMLPIPLRPSRDEKRDVDTTYAYAAIVLVGAGTGARVEEWYFPVASLLVAWALVARMHVRSRLPGALMLAMGIGMGYAVHVGVRGLQNQVEEWSEVLISDYFQGKADETKERTRIGDIGKVKLSDRILMRVVPHGARNLLLLREATFDRYFNGTWQNSVRAYKPVLRDGGDSWIVRDGPARRALTIKRSFAGGEGVLALPGGTHVISRFPAAAVDVLPTGTVRASGTPYFLAMSVAYDEASEIGLAQEGDLAVPQPLEPALDQLIRDEQLRGATPASSLAAVQKLFATKFAYSLNLSNANDAAKGRGIVDFLLRDRKGHCEYFGTGTVLVLRRLGIPARYAVGYSVQEWSDLEHAFVVRTRHAHAWTMAYLGGRWIELDTTPANWATSEAEEARSVFGPVMDMFSWLWDRVIDFWMEHTLAEIAAAIAAAFGAAAALVGVVVLWRRRRPKVVRRPTDKLGRAWHVLEARMAKRGAPRAHDETPLAWARRLHAGGAEPWRAELLDLARDYYRARFDPSVEAAAAGFVMERSARFRVPRRQP